MTGPVQRSTELRTFSSFNLFSFSFGDRCRFRFVLAVLYFILFFLATKHGLRDLSFPTRGCTRALSGESVES